MQLAVVLRQSFARHQSQTQLLVNFGKHRALGQREAALLFDLRSCSIRRDLRWGRRIHARLAQGDNDSTTCLTAALIKMYARCGSIAESRRAFDSIQTPNVASWTALLSGYADVGEARLALDLFSKMKADGCTPNSVTYIAVVRAFTTLGMNGNTAQVLEFGRRLHSEIGEFLDPYLQCTLVVMYAKLGSMVEARQVFDTIQDPNVVSWTALLSGYADNGEGLVALDLFCKMKADRCAPNFVTYIAALKACTSLADSSEKARGLQIGKEIHSEIGRHLDSYVQSTLIDMYAKLGSMLEARQVFDGILKPDVVSWTALLLGYAENGEGHVSLALFSKMKADGCTPDSKTYVAVLKACTSLAVNHDGKTRGLEMGREIHSEIGCQLNYFVKNTLVDMYAKCGSMVDACEVFETIEKPCAVAWTALLLGYADNGQGHSAFEKFSKMKADGCAPDSTTYLAVLKACSALAASGDVNEKADGLEMGREIHLEIGDHLVPYVQTTLVDMYAKCGSMIDAQRVFDRILKPDVVSWNVLLLGYEENGERHLVLDLFSNMKAGGCSPNPVTHVAVLKACSSIGDLALARKLHAEISEITVHIVTCLVDLYAKCGSMVDARAVFDLHSEARDTTTWTALLAGYSSCGDINEVLNLFEAMQDSGSRPDGVTFVSVLLCCSHAGRVRKARQYLEAMPVQYGVTPDAFHYNCVLDGLGRMNQLSEAVAVLRKMPCNPDAVTWSALLGACCKWKNVEIGRMAFQSLVDLDKKNEASTYILMAQLYGS